jgi:hypothetical protein
MSHPQRALWLSLQLALLLTCLSPARAQNESKQYSAKGGAFTFSAPSAFQDIGDAPPSALVALEVPGFGVSFLSERQAAEEVEADAAQTQAKKKLTESGAKILGSAKANLAGKPAFSLLVGGVKKGKESLFVYNLRSDYWYVFVLNYPEGQRKDAADLWQMIAPSIKFKS